MARRLRKHSTLGSWLHTGRQFQSGNWNVAESWQQSEGCRCLNWETVYSEFPQFFQGSLAGMELASTKGRMCYQPQNGLPGCFVAAACSGEEGSRFWVQDEAARLAYTMMPSTVTWKTCNVNNFQLAMHRVERTGKMVFFESTIDPTLIQNDEVLMRVDKLAITSNTLTYLDGAYGNSKYTLLRNIYPVHQFSSDFVSAPVWGFATVLASRSERVVAGERVFGFFPVAKFVSLKVSAPPLQKKGAGLLDASDFGPRVFQPLFAERSVIPRKFWYYNVLYRSALTTQEEDAHAVVFPLFATGYWLAYDMWRHEQRAASHHPSLVVTAASSSTAFSFAFCVKQLLPGAEVIGVTSSSHVPLVRDSGFYTRAISYEGLRTSLIRKDSVAWDFLGNQTILSALQPRVLATRIAGNAAHDPTCTDTEASKGREYFAKYIHVMEVFEKLQDHEYYVANLQRVAWQRKYIKKMTRVGLFHIFHYWGLDATKSAFVFAARGQTSMIVGLHSTVPRFSGDALNDF